MIKHSSLVYLAAVVLGFGIVFVDLFADGGEISPAVVLSLLLVAGAIIGVIHSRFSFWLALLISISLPAVHLILHLRGYKTKLQPDTVASILLVGMVALCTACIGVLIGASARRAATRT